MTSCGCTSEAEHAKHLMSLLREDVTSNDLEDLNEDELYLLADRYKLTTKPKKDYTTAALIILILSNRTLFSNRNYPKYPFDNYYKTPKGLDQRLQAFAQNFTFKIVNNAVKIVGKTHGVLFFQWITRPDLSKTGPCPICAPRHLKRYKPQWFLPALPAHNGCVCEWQLIIKVE